MCSSDLIVTAGELSTYIRRRFRREGDIPATNRDDENNYQNVVIERGGLQIEDAIVRLAGGPQVAAAPPPPRRAAQLQAEPVKAR